MITGTTRATPVLLWSRAALLASVVLVVSVVGHVSADGLLPGPVAMVALLVATTVLSARFLTRQVSAPRLVAMLVLGQGVIHGLLTVLAGHGGSAAAASSGAGSAAGSAGWVFDGRQVERTGSYFDQVAAMQSAPVARAADGGAQLAADGATGTATGISHAAGSGVAHLVEHLAAQGGVMILAHLAVVAALGLWLAAGERALWTVLTLTTTQLLDVVAHARALVLGRWPVVLLERVRRAPYLASTGRSAVPLPHLVHHVVAHRGPPALLTAA